MTIWAYFGFGYAETSFVRLMIQKVFVILKLIFCIIYQPAHFLCSGFMRFFWYWDGSVFSTHHSMNIIFSFLTRWRNLQSIWYIFSTVINPASPSHEIPRRRNNQIYLTFQWALATSPRSTWSATEWQRKIFIIILVIIILPGRNFTSHTD